METCIAHWTINVMAPRSTNNSLFSIDQSEDFVYPKWVKSAFRFSENLLCQDNYSIILKCYLIFNLALKRL